MEGACGASGLSPTEAVDVARRTLRRAAEQEERPLVSAALWGYYYGAYAYRLMLEAMGADAAGEGATRESEEARGAGRAPRREL
jgi:hypothetical protein